MLFTEHNAILHTYQLKIPDKVTEELAHVNLVLCCGLIVLQFHMNPFQILLCLQLINVIGHI